MGVPPRDPTAVSRHGHASARRSDVLRFPPPLPGTSNPETEFVGNRPALRYEKRIQLP